MISNAFEGPSSSECARSEDWAWHDPFDDCSYATDHGLEVRAANGRDLWYINLGAPRLLRPTPTASDFAVQTVCGPVSQERPAIGGLLLWQDKENYLRLDIGTRGANEISFQGCVANADMIIGRGRLTPLPKRGITLRLERVGDSVRALCSADGETWYTAGSITFHFAGEPPLQVGLHAIGHIDRTIFHGAYPDGTAIRFESFEMWGM